MWFVGGVINVMEMFWYFGSYCWMSECFVEKVCVECDNWCVYVM